MSSIKLEDCNDAVYDPDTNRSVTLLHPITKRDLWGDHKTFDELKEEYPNCCIMDSAEMSELIDENNKGEILEISKDDFWEMLECLLPKDWFNTSDGESFKMIEYYSRNITDIYIRIGERYFTKRDSASLRHNEIMKMTHHFIKMEN